MWPFLGTLQETNISHLGKRKSIDSNMPYQGDMFVSWRVSMLNFLVGPFFPQSLHELHILHITKVGPRKPVVNAVLGWWFHIFSFVDPETWGRFPF